MFKIKVLSYEQRIADLSDQVELLRNDMSSEVSTLAARMAEVQRNQQTLGNLVKGGVA